MCQLRWLIELFIAVYIIINIIKYEKKRKKTEARLNTQVIVNQPMQEQQDIILSRATKVTSQTFVREWDFYLHLLIPLLRQIFMRGTEWIGHVCNACTYNVKRHNAVMRAYALFRRELFQAVIGTYTCVRLYSIRSVSTYTRGTETGQWAAACGKEQARDCMSLQTARRCVDAGVAWRTTCKKSAESGRGKILSFI